MLELRDIGVEYRTRSGERVTALEGVTLGIPTNTIVSVLGPSGCGKSSLLRVLAGLTSASAGSVLFDGRPIIGPGVDRGMVFQAYTLFPWLTVRGNVSFGLREMGMGDPQRGELADRYIELVGLKGFADAYPKELSGGMTQRVALARSLANDPKVLLMDEPFSALDAQTRLEMQLLLLDVWQRQPKTIVFVTHDVDEALLLSDRVCVMSGRPGRIIHEEEVRYPRPRNLDLRRQPCLEDLRDRMLSLISLKDLNAQ